MADNRYKNGKIYRLVNDVDDEFYVGSTCLSLPKRLYYHKQDARRGILPAYQHFNNVGWENVKIILIEEYACDNKMELERQERKWIEELKPTLNKVVPTRTRQEYRNDNREVLREKKKQYYESNKETINQKNRLYHERNKDTLNEKQRQKYASKKEQQQQQATP